MALMLSKKKSGTTTNFAGFSKLTVAKASGGDFGFITITIPSGATKIKYDAVGTFQGTGRTSSSSTVTLSFTSGEGEITISDLVSLEIRNTNNNQTVGFTKFIIE